jgi:hypothetical protein
LLLLDEDDQANVLDETEVAIEFLEWVVDLLLLGKQVCNCCNEKCKEECENHCFPEMVVHQQGTLDLVVLLQSDHLSFFISLSLSIVHPLPPHHPLLVPPGCKEGDCEQLDEKL